MAEYQVIKYKHGKLSFEVLTSMGSVLKYRDGKITNIQHVIVSDEVCSLNIIKISIYPLNKVYTDHKKGKRASSDELMYACSLFLLIPLMFFNL